MSEVKVYYLHAHTKKEDELQLQGLKKKGGQIIEDLFLAFLRNLHKISTMAAQGLPFLHNLTIAG